MTFRVAIRKQYLCTGRSRYGGTAIVLPQRSMMPTLYCFYLNGSVRILVIELQQPYFLHTCILFRTTLALNHKEKFLFW